MDHNTRLSRKAQEKVAIWANTFDQVLRIKASNLATIKGKEFADEADVEEAYKIVILSMAKDISQ